MTDKPVRTMMLGPLEWRAIVMSALASMHGVVERSSHLPPDAETSAHLQDTLDRLKMQVSAWGASGQSATPMLREISDEAAEEAIRALRDRTNGTSAPASEPKKKRGWQKGRKRGPRKAKGTEAVQ